MWLKWPKLTFQRLNIYVWNVHMLMMSLYIKPLNSISNVVWTDVLIRKWNLLSEESADVLVVRQLQWVQDQDARPAVDQEETLCLDKDRTTWQNRFNGGDSPLYHRVPVTALLKALLQRQTQTPEHRITQKTSTKLLLSVERSGGTCTGGCCDLGEGFPAARSDPPETQEENTLKSLHFNTKPAERKSFKRKMDFRFSLF